MVHRNAEFDGLVDRIYEAALVPELWVEVIHGFVQAGGGDSGAILVLNQGAKPRAVTSANMTAKMDHFLNSTDWATTPRVGAAMRLMGLGFEPIEDYLTPSELESDPVTLGFREVGLGRQVCLALHMPSDEVVAYTVERKLTREPVSPHDIARLNALRPTLARSGLLAARLGLERARGMVDALNALGLPGAVLAASKRVVASNRLFDALSPSVVAQAGGGFALANRSSNAMLHLSIEQITSGRIAQCRSIPMPATAGHSAMVIHLVPLKRSARDIFTGAELIAVFSTLDHAKAPAAALLRGMFDLTPAEARVAQRIAEGHQVADIAEEFKVAPSTVKTHLNSVFGKTGTHRQTELVRLLSAVWIADNQFDPD